jgi:hypothetical protein
MLKPLRVDLCLCHEQIDNYPFSIAGYLAEYAERILDPNVR